MLIPGNYVGRFYREVKGCININDPYKYNELLTNLSEFKENDGILMVIDVDKFSDFCKKVSLKNLEEYIKKFFEIIASSIIEYQRGTLLKFIGDAVFAIINEDDSDVLIKASEDIRRKYLNEMKGVIKGNIPDIAIAIRRCNFLEGLIRCSFYYLDYSVWSEEVNSIFKIIKIKELPGIFIDRSIYDKLKNEENFKKLNDFYYYRSFKQNI